MDKIEIKNCVYKVHPVYNLYASDENGNIIHMVKQVPFIGKKTQKWLFVVYGKKTCSKRSKMLSCS